MNSAFEIRLAFVWLLLSLVSAAYLLLGRPGDPAALQANAAITIGVIAIALVKVRIIMREFMEVRHAPPLLHRFTDLWLVVTACALIGIYLFGEGFWQ